VKRGVGSALVVTADRPLAAESSASRE
jgi:hypothetical protein